MNRQAGFTLLEVLTSVAILTAITAMSLPVYESFVRRNDLDLSAQTIATMMRRAETYSRGASGDSAWGVAVQAGTATLFRGTSYATRTATYDETYDIPDSVSTSGLSEVQFTKLTATPNTTGTITLTSTTNSTRTITLNAKGMVDF